MITRRYVWIFSLLAVLSVIAYLGFWMLTTRYELFPDDPQLALIMRQTIFNILERRGYQVLAMVVSAVLIASTSLVFQTMTHSRILTPSLIGFDALFVLSQTAIVFFLGSGSVWITNPYLRFIFATGVMVILALVMYRFILKKDRNHMIFLLLVGMILSTLARSISSFLQTIMDPNAFQSVVISTEVTITNMNVSIILLAVPLMLAIIVMLYREFRYFDVMALGESEAIGLGVPYHKKMNGALIYIAFAMAIATALIGPISFLGLLAVNAAREMLKTYKHKDLMIVSSLLAIVFLVLGQTIISETGYQTTVTVLINLVGGIYMIYLILKENRT